MSKLVILPAPVVAVPPDQVIVDELVMDGYHDVPLFQIRISKTNRQRFNLEALQELAASIADVGIMQPILLRCVTPTEGELQPYEIIAGERRFRASVMANLAAVPARIVNMTDEQALRIQLLENIQRENPHPLEEAEGYQQLMMGFGLSVEQIMETVHQSRTYVYNRIKLCSLCTPARDAFFDDLISTETAQLVARIPNPKLQAQAVKEITSPTHHRESPMTFREAREHIRRHFTLSLTSATFPIKDATLTEAGSCIECPKRAGNQLDFEGDKKSADVCTDPACFADKRAAQINIERAAAKSKGIPVIAGNDASKIMPNTWSELKGGYVNLDKEFHTGGKFTTYRKLLGKQLPPVALLEQPHNGEMLTIAKAADIDAVLTAAGKTIPETDRTRRQAEKEREKQQAAAAKIEREYRRRLFTAVRAAATPELTPVDVRNAALALLRQCGDTLPFIATIYGWTSSQYEGGYDGNKYITGSAKLATLVETLDVEQAAVLIRDVMWTHDLTVNTYTGANEKPSRLLAVAAQFNVDAAQIRKDVKRDADAKATKKPKANQPKVAAPAQMELPQPGLIDPSIEAAMTGDIHPLKEFLSANPDRINDLAKAVVLHRPDLAGQLKYVASQLNYSYSDGTFNLPKQTGPAADEESAPAQRTKLQIKSKPAPESPSDGPVIKVKKKRAVTMPVDDGLPADMDYPT